MTHTTYTRTQISYARLSRRNERLVADVAALGDESAALRRGAAALADDNQALRREVERLSDARRMHKVKLVGREVSACAFLARLLRSCIIVCFPSI